MKATCLRKVHWYIQLFPRQIPDSPIRHLRGVGCRKFLFCLVFLVHTEHHRENKSSPTIRHQLHGKGNESFQIETKEQRSLA